MCSRTRSVSGTRPTCNMAPVLIRFSGFVGSPPKTRTFPNWAAAVPAAISRQSFCRRRSDRAALQLLRRARGNRRRAAPGRFHSSCSRPRDWRRSGLSSSCPRARACSKVAIIFSPPGGFRAVQRGSISCFPSSDCIIAEEERPHQCHPSRGGRDKCHLPLWGSKFRPGNTKRAECSAGQPREICTSLRGLLRIPNKHRKSTKRERRRVRVIRCSELSTLCY